MPNGSQLAFRKQSTTDLRERWFRPLMLGLAALLLIAGAFVGRALVNAAIRDDVVGLDYRLFGEIGRRFAETGSAYAQYQLERPYRYDEGLLSGDVRNMPSLYPPWAGPVFAVTRFLPAVFWWAIPLVTISWLVVNWRPAPWAWPIIALATVSPNTWGLLVAGGTSMWVAMFVGLGLPYGWPAGFVAFKPTFLPFAIVGWRNRWTWLIVFIFGLVAVAMTDELRRYSIALQNVEGVSLAYSVGDLPWMMVPVVAWVARTSGSLRASGRGLPGRVLHT